MTNSYKITYGGWYHRTTLHLSEIYDLFAKGASRLDLSKKKLKELVDGLRLEEVSREAGYLEFVKARTKDGISIRYYEDGLYVLESESENIAETKKRLEDYFENFLSPAVNFIFSLGAPTPKVLANIKTSHPTVISLVSDNHQNFKVPIEYGDVYSRISSEGIAVYKTPESIFVISNQASAHSVVSLVEMQIFFREFKDQLEKYLNIHRSVWEEIADIKERRMVKGNEIEALRAKLDSYQKTVSLIGNRINQMGTYVRTRASISKSLELEQRLTSLFQFKFEILTDTLDYIKELWKMTSDYLMQAIQVVVEVKNQGTTRGIQSLQLITSIGVVSGILGYFSRNELPKFTAIGAVYFVLIIAVTWFINRTVTQIYTKKKYQLKFTERTSRL